MFKNVKKEEITIPAQMSYLTQIRDFVEHIGKRFKYSDKMINSFKLVIDEACTNIIRHGYRDIKNGEIQLKAIMRRLSLTIVIIDQGISYDPRQANTPDLAKYVDIGKKGGLGILMMRKLMDDIQYVVTEHGNEFRLTKFRESVDESKPMQMWHALNMRTRYSLISSLIITVIAAVIFGFFFANLRSDVNKEIFSIASTSARTLADNSSGDMLVGEFLPLIINASSVVKGTEIDIFQAFIVDNDSKVIAGFNKSGNSFMGGNYQLPQDAAFIDSSQMIQIYKYAFSDSMDVYDVKSDVREVVGGQSTKLGEAHVRIASDTIEDIINSKRITLITVLIIVLSIGYAGSFYLVSQILKSFHSLADWVRQVVRGKVDQDEIDIDTSDEIGEIAQAFNEMTDKFRKAQVNLMEQQKLQKELQVAQEIQQMLLPSDFPKVEGFDIGSYYEAAKEVGGDLFDFVEVDDETVGIVVADVSGKGVPGSLIMTMIRTAIRLESRGNKNPADVLAKVNRFVTDDMKRGMFVTMFYIILDSRNRVIRYASAGHNPMILFRSSAKQTYYLNPSGFPVGIQLPDIKLFENKIETDSIRLREDDILVLYTDGITEAMNHKRELYREERFLQSIRDNGHLDVAEFVKSIKDDLKNYTGGAPQNDDITFVAIKEKLMTGEIIYKTHKHLIELINNGMRVQDACEKLNVSQYQYYKYKDIVDEGGLDALREYLDGQDYIEKKHLSIELKSKMFDIIRENPKYGAKKISDLLATEKYGNTQVEERRIYNELVKLRLNTYPLRQRFVDKGQNKRLKQPGTPLLTLDGKVILDFESSTSEINKRTGNTQSFSTGDNKEEEKKPFVREIRPSTQDSSRVRMMHQTGKAFDPSRQVTKDESAAKTPTEKPAQQTKEEIKEQEPEIIENKQIHESVKEKQVTETPAETKPSETEHVEEVNADENIEIVEKEPETPVLVEKVSTPTTDELKSKAIEQLDPEKVERFFYECKDDFDAVAESIEKLKENAATGDDLKKVNLILKITLKHPILKELPEINQLISQIQQVFAMIHENFDGLGRTSIIKNAETMLNYMKKENILNDSQSILEKINRVGLIHKQFENHAANVNPKNNLQNIRNKIAKKHLVKDSSLLQSLGDNPKN
ncbi:MAG: SpoIIE family protein phosphatase [Calditrichae bacterium]|nr:SpoIIE family protein phosphatase [Calditrichia bacterium]